MSNIQPIIDNVSQNLIEVQRILEEVTKKEITPPKVNQYEEYKKLKRLSFSKKMDKVSKISKIIDFFEEIFVIDELYLSERRQIFYLLNKLENDEVNKLSIKLEKFKKTLDSLRIEVRSIEKMIGYKGDFREEHSLYEIEGKVRLYILDTLLPKYGFKGIKEDF